jgi:WD40 repeat protein
MTGSHRSGIFLSYARKDGEQFAGILLERLREKAPDIVIKQDRLLLEGGVGWWKQLADAIDSVEYLVLIMTPSAMQSETVRKEWRYARQQGICVYPVKAVSDSALRFSDLPRWMSKVHFFDIEREWETFLAHLRKGCDKPRVPFMAPDLPENFTERPDEFGRLRNLLLSPDRKDPVAITAALSGGGGFGKTTLAAALCHDEDIIQNFDDGIIWVTLGKNPDVMSGLVTAYAALTGERPGFANEEDAAFHLGQKLEDRACLLVVDDVWDEFNLRPFLHGGRGCARLFTTRMPEIASCSRTVIVEEMREAESLELLTKGLQGLDSAQALEISRRLGEWPIALELASAMMRRRVEQGDTAERAAQRLLEILERKGTRGLEKTTGPPRHRSIDSVLLGSLELLSDEDRTRLKELSVFPEDIAIPLDAAAALWGIEEFESEEKAQRYARLSLLKLDLGRGSMRLHDVLRSWLAVHTTNARELHSGLVDAWPDWMQLPSAYAWRWLIWHLAQAGRNADSERVLYDPEWLLAKLRATDVNALIGDFEFLKPTPVAQLIQGALRLSSHVLAKDPSQFSSQMRGRLLSFQEQAPIQRFIVSVDRAADLPWLRPLNPALDPPGTALLRTLAGHSDSVYDVALTPDGGRAVSASADKTLKVWDLETSSEIRTLAGHSKWVNAVAVMPDGQRAISASQDGTLKVWDLDTGEVVRTLECYLDPVKWVAVTPDGRRAVSNCRRYSLYKKTQIWDLDAGEEVSSPFVRFDSAAAVTRMPDGRRVVLSACEDFTLQVWDLDIVKEERTLVGHSNFVNAVAVTPDGRRTVSASSDHTLKVWNLETGTQVRTLVGHSDSVNAVAVTPDGRRAVSVSSDHTLKVWDLETGEEMRSLAGHSSSVNAVAVTPDGRRAVSASSDHTLKVWDLESRNELQSAARQSYLATAMAVTPDGRRTIFACRDKTLKIWDLDTNREVRTLAGHSSVFAVAVTPDGRRAVSASREDTYEVDETLKLWDLDTGNEACTLDRKRYSHRINSVAVTPNGRHAVVAYTDTTLKVWDLGVCKEVSILVGHSYSVNAVAVTPDGWHVVSASADKTLKVWDLETGSEMRTLIGHSDIVDAIAVTPDGLRAVSASMDHTVKVWDLETGKQMQTFSGPGYWVNAVAVTMDGRHVVIASSNKTLNVWDIETGATVATFVCDSAVWDCACANDRTILALDARGRVHILSFELAKQGAY